MNSSVQIAVYDNRVEISSPGTLYGTLTLEEALGGRSSIRNKTLARTLEKINVLEFLSPLKKRKNGDKYRKRR